MPVIVEEPRATVNPDPVAPPVSVPVDASEDAVTPAASVDPVSPDAGAAVAVMVPEPEVVREPPVPITREAVVFVPPTIFAQR